MGVRLDGIALANAIKILGRLFAWCVATNELKGSGKLYRARMHLEEQYRLLSVEHRYVKL